MKVDVIVIHLKFRPLLACVTVYHPKSQYEGLDQLQVTCIAPSRPDAQRRRLERFVC
jgi:hypothetical protein